MGKAAAAKRAGRKEWQPFQLEIEGEWQVFGETWHRKYSNNKYVVLWADVERGKDERTDWPGTIVHLSIHDTDRTHLRDWREYQRIKNELLGVEWEAVELYPAESRLVDGANQYHLWCFPPPFRFPFGMTARSVIEKGSELEKMLHRLVPMSRRAVQR